MAQYQTERLTITIENDHVNFDGVIDELFVYTKIPPISAPIIKVNLKSLRKINSCGIRELISWLNSLSQTQQVYYEDAPIFFIHQANMVHGIVASNRRVSSFYCPYFDEKKDEEVEKLITVEELKGLQAPSFEGLVFDSVEEKYFNFLRLQGERL
jgi:hypothetical protein